MSNNPIEQIVKVFEDGVSSPVGKSMAHFVRTGQKDEAIKCFKEEEKDLEDCERLYHHYREKWAIKAMEVLRVPKEEWDKIIPTNYFTGEPDRMFLVRVYNAVFISMAIEWGNDRGTKDVCFIDGESQLYRLNQVDDIYEIVKHKQ